MSREVVCVSLNIFDRYLATRGNRCSGTTALLTSLTTLQIAIKLYDPRKVRHCALANLSRGQFSNIDIDEMEWSILSALDWKVHPPTHDWFLWHFILFLPQETNPSVRKGMYDMSRYLCELAVYDSYFVSMNNSTVAFAALLNVLEDTSFLRLPVGLRETFLREISSKLGLSCYNELVALARQRLRLMFIATTGCNNPNQTEMGSDHYRSPQQCGGNATNPTTSCIVADCNGSVLGNKSLASTSSAGSGSRPPIHSRTNSFDSKGSLRYSPSLRRRCVAISPMSCSLSRTLKNYSPMM